MSARQLTVAVVGATGAVGEALLTVLAEREFPIAKLYAVASGKKEDETAMYAERPVLIDTLDDFDFSRCQIAFFCVPAKIAKKYAPRAVKAGCWVIDTSSQFRLDPKVPLVVPAVNREILANATGPQIVASPAAHVVQAAIIAAPLQKKFGLVSLDAVTTLAVSTLGKRGINELAGQTARLLNAQAIQQKVFPSQIAFNLIPAFDAPHESGYTLEESNSAAEIKKVLMNEQLEASVSLAFAPVFYGNSQSLRIQTKEAVTASAAQDEFQTVKSIELSGGDEAVSPVGMAGSDDVVHVGRVAQVGASGHRLNIWSVTDNVRKGAAVNSVEIAETLLESHL